MSSSKRRKLTTPPSNSQLSAFAVRHTLKNKPCDSSTDEHNSGFNSQSVKVQAKGSASIDLIDNSANVDGSLEPKNSSRCFSLYESNKEQVTDFGQSISCRKAK